MHERSEGGGKAPLPSFLAQNPFPNPLTDGFFYREKMRAIHRIAPGERFGRILEVGGGQGGLTGLLYPGIRIVNIDLDAMFAAREPNRRPGTTFLCGDATRLPFPDGAFDAVTMFDLLEHVPDDALAAREALRVLRPGGVVMISTPDEERWHYPYYRALRRYCPRETTLMCEWGHVRRGYTMVSLERLFGGPPEATASFINPLTALCHDIAFSRLNRRQRLPLYAMASPLTAFGYMIHGFGLPGTEIAARWRKRPDPS